MQRKTYNLLLRIRAKGDYSHTDMIDDETMRRLEWLVRRRFILPRVDLRSGLVVAWLPIPTNV